MSATMIRFCRFGRVGERPIVTISRTRLTGICDSFYPPISQSSKAYLISLINGAVGRIARILELNSAK
jgi:hypothetical protein